MSQSTVPVNYFLTISIPSSLQMMSMSSIKDNQTINLTEFRQPLQVQSHLEMPGILVQLGHTQRT